MDQNILHGIDFDDTMDINAPAGTKIVFTGKNGWESEKQEALKRLKVGETYTVISTDIGGWKTYVYIEEYPGYGFNSVHFVKAK